MNSENFMKVLFVCNNAFVAGNGLSTSVRNTVRYLRESGVDARILSGENPDTNGPKPDFTLKRFHFPLFQPIIDANGYSFATMDRKVINEAVAWADLVHIAEPFPIERAVIRVAEKMGKPVVGTFHLYTENIMTELPPVNWRWTNHLLMNIWMKGYFNHCSDIQCPSRTVKELMERCGSTSRLHVISNGIPPSTTPGLGSHPQEDPILILNVGRLAAAKDQITLLRAMEYSRHASRIQLYFAGQGQLLKKYRAVAAGLVKRGVLTHTPVFAFHTPAQLHELASRAYLCVHCANIEVEGLGCLESIREGCVPLIAEGPLVATSEFALVPESTFPASDPKALAEKIDWWIEHPEKRAEMSPRYAESVKDYSIESSMEKLMQMYTLALSGK